MIVAVVLLVGVGILMSFLPVQRPDVPDLVRKPILSMQIDVSFSIEEVTSTHCNTDDD